jgi:hypothetical protein
MRKAADKRLTRSPRGPIPVIDGSDAYWDAVESAISRLWIVADVDGPVGRAAATWARRTPPAAPPSTPAGYGADADTPPATARSLSQSGPGHRPAGTPSPPDHMPAVVASIFSMPCSQRSHIGLTGGRPNFIHVPAARRTRKSTGRSGTMPLKILPVKSKSNPKVRKTKKSEAKKPKHR